MFSLTPLWWITSIWLYVSYHSCAPILRPSSLFFLLQDRAKSTCHGQKNSSDRFAPYPPNSVSSREQRPVVYSNCTPHIYCCALQYARFTDTSACRQESKNTFHLHTCWVPFGGMGTDPSGRSRLLSTRWCIGRSNRVHDISPPILRPFLVLSALKPCRHGLTTFFEPHCRSGAKLSPISSNLSPQRDCGVNT